MRTRAQFLVAVAENDDKSAPNEKTVLTETFDHSLSASENAKSNGLASVCTIWCASPRRTST